MVVDDTQLGPHIVVAPPGPKSRELTARAARVESPAFETRREARAKVSGAEQVPIAYARGAGVNVFDVDGNRYVDLTAGFGALVLGHRPAAVSAAVARQMDTLWLALGDVYASEEKIALCERLAAYFPEPGARVMLGSSGADAVTAALKTAVLHTGKPGVIAFRGGYHGLSYAPLAACGLSEGFRAPFAEQLGRHVTFAPYPHDATALEASLAAVEQRLAAGGVGAVLVEPILGRGGCVVPPPDFLPSLRRACDAHGALLVVDEFWTGLGRSGARLASLDAGAVPDVVCLGKALGGGFPVSACVGRESVMRAWGTHGGTAIHTATHFGNPIVSAAALATLDALESSDLAARARDVGGRWMDRLRERLGGLGVSDVRGKGLMVGIALDGGAARALAIARALLARGYIVLTGGTGGDVLTLTPPLTIDEGLLFGFADALADALRERA